VNWKFLPEYLFVNPLWSFVLLLGHIVGLIIWYQFIVRRIFDSLRISYQQEANKKRTGVLLDRVIVTTLFQCQFIGVVFARSIHYQFYAWYFHSLPWILYSLGINLPQSCLLLLAIEIVYNSYPPSWYMSMILQCCHLYIISQMLSFDSHRRITFFLSKSIKESSNSTQKNR
jgi:alpha-1,3-mannosyltransferase